jgi:heme A synthase
MAEMKCGVLLDCVASSHNLLAFAFFALAERNVFCYIRAADRQRVVDRPSRMLSLESNYIG